MKIEDWKKEVKEQYGNIGFSRGSARLVDLFGFLDKKNVQIKSDEDAIKESWEKVGDNLAEVMGLKRARGGKFVRNQKK